MSILIVKAVFKREWGKTFVYGTILGILTLLSNYFVNQIINTLYIVAFFNQYMNFLYAAILAPLVTASLVLFLLIPIVYIITWSYKAFKDEKIIRNSFKAASLVTLYIIVATNVSAYILIRWYS